MNKVLKKRLPRELKSNFTKYLALMLLIVMGMYLVISIVGSAETIITRSEEKAEENKVEDGQFGVFIPLTDGQKKEIAEAGYTLEEMFSLDMEAEDGSILRAMKVRESINLIELDTGTLPEKDGECVLEKRYAEEHDLAVGDTIMVSDIEMKIVGVGSTPDYEAPYQSFSDTAVSSESFGTIFLTEDFYEYIRDNVSLKAESYCYAYRLGDGNTSKELKTMLQDFTFDYEDIEDEYYKEMIDEILETRYEIEDGIGELSDGAAELSDGLSEIDTAFGSLPSEITGSLGVAITQAHDGAVSLSDGIDELQEEASELLDEVFTIDVDNLTSFVEKEDNVRIGAAAGDVILNKTIGLIAGVIIMVLFMYVISVFVVHQIQQETGVIGALYALGAKKKDLMLHYIMLPTLTAFVGGVIGTAIGFSPIGITYQMAQSYSYFSLPIFENVYSGYLLIYGIVMPPIIAVLVNILVINKRLSKTALSLMRNEQKTPKAKLKTETGIKSGSFEGRFQMRQIVREIRCSLTVIAGMLIALCVVMLSLDCYVYCYNIQDDMLADTKYEYMYTFKYPEEEVPEGGEACYVESLSKESYGYTLDVSIMGIDDDNPYFPDMDMQEGKSKVIISSAVSSKYNLDVGDILTLSDEANEMVYAFTVEDIVTYEAGLMVFMDIDSMRELFGQEDDYYNCVLSDHELDIDEGRLYSTTTRANIEGTAGTFVDEMGAMITVLIAAGIIIYFAIMYLMQGVMIDRASFGISLMKTFGYRTKEVKKLYLNGNFYTVLVGAVIGIPLSKLVMDKMYPSFVPNVAAGINLTFSWQLYLLVFLVIIVIYFIINALLVRKINKITPAEVLKNRE